MRSPRGRDGISLHTAVANPSVGSNVGLPPTLRAFVMPILIAGFSANVLDKPVKGAAAPSVQYSPPR